MSNFHVRVRCLRNGQVVAVQDIDVPNARGEESARIFALLLAEGRDADNLQYDDFEALPEDCQELV